jgi:tRNA threonylcarbamoyladenosine biosynthesis protein TsaE
VTAPGRGDGPAAGPGAAAERPPAAGARRVTASAEETERLGAAFAAGLAAGDVLALSGPLGAGKTRFVAGLARGLGVPARVRSPSFTLLNEYRGRLALRHLDLYRLEGGDADGLGLEEQADEGVLAVEWGEKLPGWLREEALTLAFEILSPQQRALTASAAAGRGLELLASWNRMPAAGR